jgi:hypothetical protein
LYDDEEAPDYPVAMRGLHGKFEQEHEQEQTSQEALHPVDITGLPEGHRLIVGES